VANTRRGRSAPEASAPPPVPTPAAAILVEGYCVRERKKVAIKDPVQTTMKNGKPAIRGVCPDCGTKIFRIGSLP
jgi:hypothetical protein